jgi:ribosomal protein S18 acetylase RimI-like enzyme
VPPGYRLATVADGVDVDIRVAVHRAAFDPSKVTDVSYGSLQAEGTYDPSLDYVVVAPDGSLAAFCLAWHDASTQSGLLEPVGTHPGHRRRGLARAACTAAVRALAERGARSCVVLSWSGDSGATQLYRSIGFETVARHVGWKAPVRVEALA